MTTSTPGGGIYLADGTGVDAALPATAHTLAEPKRRVFWSLSWPAAAAGLALMAAAAVNGIVGSDNHYQQSRNFVGFASSPLDTAVLTFHAWRAIGVLVPWAMLALLCSVASVLVVAQHRRIDSSAARWRRLVVGLATGCLAIAGLGLVVVSLFASVTGTQDVWVVRTAGSVIGVLVTAASLYVMLSPAFRPSVIPMVIGLVIIAMLTVTAQVSNSTGGTYGNSWSNVGFASLSVVGKRIVYFSADCPARGSCIAQGMGFGPTTETIATTNGGDSWTRRVAGPWAPPTLWLSCWDVAHCVGARGGTVVTGDQGRSWQKAAVPSTFASESVECSAPGTCILVGSSVPPFTDSGARGTSIAEVLLTPDGGSTWSQGQLPSGSEDLHSIVCATSSACYATGTLTRDTTSPGVILESEDAGVTWSGTALPPGVPLLSQMACGDASHCVAVGSTRTTGVPQTSIAVWTSDGGFTWNRSVIPGHNNVVRVACISALTCLAAGQGSQRLVLFETNDGGAIWTTGPAQFPKSNYLTDSSLALSCAQGGFCMMVSGTYAATSTDGGTTWRERGERQSGLPG